MGWNGCGWDEVCVALQVPLVPIQVTFVPVRLRHVVGRQVPVGVRILLGGGRKVGFKFPHRVGGWLRVVVLCQVRNGFPLRFGFGG